MIAFDPDGASTNTVAAYLLGTKGLDVERVRSFEVLNQDVSAVLNDAQVEFEVLDR